MTSRQHFPLRHPLVLLPVSTIPLTRFRLRLDFCLVRSSVLLDGVLDIAYKQGLHMGYAKICFRIAKGRVKDRRACNGPCTIWVLPFPFDRSLPRVMLDSTKIATVALRNRKTRTTQAEISVKNSENCSLKAKPWMETSFPNFPYVI